MMRCLVNTQAGSAVPVGDAIGAGQADVGPVLLDSVARAERSRRAGPVTGRLRDEGVNILALCLVDNTGVTRVKCVPVEGLARAAGWGVGISPVFDVFLVNDAITASRHIGGPVGDLRRIPDLDRITVLAGQPGWAMAPADRYTQD